MSGREEGEKIIVKNAGKQNETELEYTVFTNGGHAGKNWCLVMKARRWRINKNFK